MKILNHQQVIDDLQDLERLAYQLAHTYVKSVATYDITEDEIQTLAQGVKEAQQIIQSISISIQP